MQGALDLCWIPQILVQCIQEISVILLFQLIISHRPSKTWWIFSQEMLGSVGLQWCLIQQFPYSHTPRCAHLLTFSICLCSSVCYSLCLSVTMVEGMTGDLLTVFLMELLCGTYSIVIQRQNQVPLGGQIQVHILSHLYSTYRSSFF